LKNQSIHIHQQLLDRCKKGESRAQFEIYQLYYKPMYTSSLRIVGVAAVAEDIMQESFLAAFRKLDSWRGEVTFGAWLKKIVINRSLDYLRKQKVEFEELKQNLPIAEEEDPEIENITIEEVKSAISLLPDGYRAILSLILFEGFNHEEASHLLGIQNVSSRTQFLRARRKLQEILIAKQRTKEKVYE
jgi:RNA polymerase sigma-70 factor (ECF subfamily)